MNFEISKLIRDIGLTIHYINDQRLKPHGITMPQAGLLGLIDHGIENNMELSRKDLERISGFKGATITGLLDKLEKNGFIKRNISPTDGRALNISITDKGKDILKIGSLQLEFSEQHLLHGLTSIEKNVLKDLLFKLQKNVTVKPRIMPPPEE